MTLDQHLDGGYDYIVRGARGKWMPEQFVSEMQADAALAAAARQKRAALEAVVAAGRRCDVSKIQLRVLKNALESLTRAEDSSESSPA